MDYLLSCNSWLESIAKKEINRLWYEIDQVNDKLIFFKWDEKTIAKVNIWSRVWNKLFLILWKKNVTSFDDLFEFIYTIKWNEYIWEEQGFIVKAIAIDSKLSSLPTIQSISQKSIISKLIWSKDKTRFTSPNIGQIEIVVVLHNDIASIMLNSTWSSLHKRWYKTESAEAPLKENIASGIVNLISWKYSLPLYDFFCGSWTILIEACLIAKNIAPWSFRRFSFEDFIWYDKNIKNDIIKEAKESIIIEKSHTIVWYDKDLKVLESARQNAINAWVDKFIKFEYKDFNTINLNDYKDIFMLSNPPYWLRLKQTDIYNIYKKLSNLFELWDNIKWWIFTWYEDFDKIIDKNMYKLRKLYNWWEKCYLYKYLWNELLK